MNFVRKKTFFLKKKWYIKIIKIFTNCLNPSIPIQCKIFFILISSYAAQKHAKVNNIDLTNELIMFYIILYFKRYGKNIMYLLWTWIHCTVDHTVDIKCLHC